MADGIDRPPDALQATATDAILDRGLGDAGINELITTDPPVLTFGEPGDHPIDISATNGSLRS